MFALMLQKLLHKKWMMLSLALGNILLIAIAVAYPMFRDASLNRMLWKEFATYEQENNQTAALVNVQGKKRKSANPEAYAYAEKLSETVCQELGVTESLRLRHSELVQYPAKSSLDRGTTNGDYSYAIGSFSDFEEKAELVSGRMYSHELAEDGCYEAVVTVRAFVQMNLLVGEELNFEYLTDPQGNQVRVRVVGVVTCKDASDPYWVIPPDDLNTDLLIYQPLFDEYFINGGKRYDLNSNWYSVFDYEKLSFAKVEALIDKSNELFEKGSSYGGLQGTRYVTPLTDFLEVEKKVNITLLILQVPVLILLCAFLYMISSQMFSLEQSEISLMKSRGASNKQVFSLYLQQAIFMGCVGLVFGLPLGSFICKALGSCSAFLEFVQRKPLQVHLTTEVFAYAGIAFFVAVLMAIIPTRKAGRLTIVGQKVSKARQQKPIWQKLFLDLVLLVVSLYGYYSFSRQKDLLAAQMLEGKQLDPLLYMSSSLFILGAALLMLRVLPYLVKLVYIIGKKHWGPAYYASFLEILRTGTKQYFIEAFLVLTVALGIFNTTVARTIEENTAENLTYLSGADLVLQEAWPNNSMEVAMFPDTPLVYREPDYGKFSTIEGVASVAKVYVNDKGKVPVLPGIKNLRVMGIHTKDFGNTTNLRAGLMEQHFYDYLNEMSVDADYLLVSSSFRDIEGYEKGDTLTFEIGESTISGVIADFVDYFPGFPAQIVSSNADGSTVVTPQYLIVAHLSTIQKYEGVTPYQVWMKLQEGAGTAGFYDFLEENKVSVASLIDLPQELTDIRNDTLFEGTNGILTMSFLVILLLCFVGYLIYWTLTIRSRELLFGVLRAMGLSKGEIILLLINEQFFDSILPLLAGAGIGVVASKLYVPLIQLAYAASQQALPMTLITRTEDMIRLFVIVGIMMLLGLIALARQVYSMKIAQALKLGED